MWETHPNDYRVFSKMSDFLSLIPWSSTFQDSGGWVKFPKNARFTESNSRGLPPPHPILEQTIDRCISLLRRFLWSFSFLSLARIKHRRLLCSTKNRLTIAISFAILEQSRVILSQAGWARYIVICINPAFTKMIHGTENPKSLLNLQNAQCIQRISLQKVHPPRQNVTQPFLECTPRLRSAMIFFWD